MPTKLDPIVSEFETQEQADSYDRWFRSTVESSINSDSPRIPHDEVMAGARHIIEQAKAKKKIGLTLMLTVKWTDEAKTGLYTLLAFIAERNPLAAEALLQRIEESVIPLAEHPYLFRPGRVNGTREMVVHPNYIVVYRVLAAHIEIVSVLHARQEYP